VGWAWLAASLPAGAAQAAVRVEADRAQPALAFAAAEIEAAAAEQPSAGELRVVLATDAGAGLGSQGYRIARPDPGTVRVTGGSAVGAMYGGLDVAEAIRLGTVASLATAERRPFVEYRGIKFNLPLDLRTPSYSDNADAFQANIPEVWERAFWAELLDEMARHRYNVLSLWNLHPFPSIVKVPEFPDVALADVLRAKPGSFDDGYSHSGDDMFRPALLEGAEVVRRMTIDEKIAHWRDVMQMARDRGIDVYWFTWNAFLFGAEGKHGLEREGMGEAEIRYFRASVRETVRTYPLLAGIGITAGEHMGDKPAGRSPERWLWETYGEGIRDALAQEPGRPFRLIHRFHMTNLEEIRREFRELPATLDFSYKYAVAHMYASTRPRFVDPLLAVLPKDARTWLTVRNDDIYSFRWADPGFAREFIRRLPGPEAVRGFYMGPDGYCWGREAMDLEPLSPRQLVMKKQWLSFMLWGRLSFDPTLDDAHFARVLAQRFPQVPAGELLAAWSAASRVMPEITRFFWGNIDLRWLPEASLSHPRSSGFYTIRHFAEGRTMPGEANIDVREWRRRLQARERFDGVVTHPQAAERLRAHAAAALAGAAKLRPLRGTNRELRLTLGDIESFAHLGNHYAAKIDAACALALYDASGEPARQQEAARHLESALAHWKLYAASYTRQYRQPLLYNRVGWVDIPKLTERVADDLRLAREWKPGSLPPPDPRPVEGSVFGQ
jgi:hypothetical protein